MGTRCRIGIKNADGTFRSIYSHWDGYPTHMGQTLRTHYDTAEKVNALLDLGDCSSVYAKVAPDGPHTFDNPQKGVTVAYGRDRGKTGTDPVIQNTAEFLGQEEYGYLFDGGEWFYSGYGVDCEPLTEEVCDAG